jgi:lysophospholipase L1-like esterase
MPRRRPNRRGRGSAVPVQGGETDRQRYRLQRRRHLTASRYSCVGVVGAILSSTVAVASGAGGTNVAPHFVASLGDSIPAGYATEPGPELANSWATGTNPNVNSIHLRLRQKNGSGEREFNGAQPGTAMALLQYAAASIPKGVDLVLVEMGANNVCDPPRTSADVFGDQLEAALRAIAVRAPAARVVLVSILDLSAMWDAVKTAPGARAGRDSACAAATSASGSPVLRKAIRVLNHELATVCARYAKCRYDGGAAFRIRWSRADVSTLDYLHPSIAGQRKIADAVWASGAVTRN